MPRLPLSQTAILTENAWGGWLRSGSSLPEPSAAADPLLLLLQFGLNIYAELRCDCVWGRARRGRSSR